MNTTVLENCIRELTLAINRLAYVIKTHDEATKDKASQPDPK